MNIKKSENILLLGTFLAITGLFSALILAYFSNLTEKAVAESAVKSVNKSLLQVLPEFDNRPTESPLIIDDITFYGGLLGSKLVGVAGVSAIKGYGGEIKILVGFNPDGAIRNVVVLKHNETPGLGSKICDRSEQKTIFSIFKKSEKKSGLPPNLILDYYSGKNFNNVVWKVSKDGGSCPFITGATVSSRALAKAVGQISGCYQQNLIKINTDLVKR